MNHQPCDHGRRKNDAPNHSATLPTKARERHSATALYFPTLLFSFCGVLLEVVFSLTVMVLHFLTIWSEFREDKSI